MFLRKSDKIMYLDMTESMIVWALRKVSSCSLYCATIEHEFKKVFIDNYDEAINTFREFAKCLAGGKRDLRVGTIDSPILSRDEASILEMFYAAAIDDDYRMNAHASWILGKNDCNCTLSASCKNFTKEMLKSNFVFTKKNFETMTNLPPIAQEVKGKSLLRLI